MLAIADFRLLCTSISKGPTLSILQSTPKLRMQFSEQQYYVGCISTPCIDKVGPFEMDVHIFGFVIWTFRAQPVFKCLFFLSLQFLFIFVLQALSLFYPASQVCGSLQLSFAVFTTTALKALHFSSIPPSNLSPFQFSFLLFLYGHRTEGSSRRSIFHVYLSFLLFLYLSHSHSFFLLLRSSNFPKSHGSSKFF